MSARNLGKDLDWRYDAACASIGGDLWFPERGRLAKEAKDICSKCPVAEQCLELAINDPDLQFGIWGGKTAKEIRAIRSARGLQGAAIPDDMEPEDE